MYSTKRQKGNVAEEIVVSQLKNNGFLIKDQNYLKKWGEIDIVAEKYGKIHFIEVKSIVFNGFIDVSRETGVLKSKIDDEIWKIYASGAVEIVSRETGGNKFDPVWNMTSKKKVRFSRIIRTYFADKYHENMPDFQVDLISVLLDFYQKIAYIKRIENILLEEI